MTVARPDLPAGSHDPVSAESASPAARLQAALDEQRAAFARQPNPTAAERDRWLATLLSVVLDHKQRFVEAISADFGNRSAHETLGAEVMVTAAGIRYLRQHLKEWMAVEPRHISLLFAPARGEVRYQPKGVIGVISPWNYPLQLALVPVATALAAGNRVLLKPSELSPATSALMQELLHAAFPRDLVQVVTGGPDVGAAFAGLKLDHLMYTGSTHVGRLVMLAAAQNLVPVTLELGGKSPAIVHPDAPFKVAVERVAFGKVLNAGQTCVAPDYALVPRAMEARFVDALAARFAEMLPTLATNRDYTSIINERHRARVAGLVEDARAKGARVREVNPASEDLTGSGKVAPTILQGVSDDMEVMHEEIFGPVLPVVPYDTLDDAIAYVNARPRPLALYYFDTNAGRVDKVMSATHSGGACVNDVALHVGQDDLPFGGIGPSGLGAYHGREGFLAFSHAKSVFHQRRLRLTQLFNPPYGATIDAILKVLVG
ncbi:MAG: coniferyl aldehyde dehydrogenase [Myxococcota bacterium]